MMDRIELMKGRAVALTRDAVKTFEQMDEWGEWNSLDEVVRNFKAIAQFIMLVVATVEQVAKDIAGLKEDINSEEKLSAAVATVDNFIKLPWYLEAFDGVAIKMSIKSIVVALNIILGHGWDIEKIKEALFGQSGHKFDAVS